MWRWLVAAGIGLKCLEAFALAVLPDVIAPSRVPSEPMVVQCEAVSAPDAPPGPVACVEVESPRPTLGETARVTLR